MHVPALHTSFVAQGSPFATHVLPMQQPELSHCGAVLQQELPDAPHAHDPPVHT
jgi:hypothetical protein